MPLFTREQRAEIRSLRRDDTRRVLTSRQVVSVVRALQEGAATSSGGTTSSKLRAYTPIAGTRDGVNKDFSVQMSFGTDELGRPIAFPYWRLMLLEYVQEDPQYGEWTITSMTATVTNIRLGHPPDEGDQLFILLAQRL